MSASPAAPLLPPDHPGIAELPRFRPTRRLERSPHLDRLLTAARRVGEAFPELAGREVRLDLLSSASRYRGLTFPLERPPRVAVRPHTRTPLALHATLAHEFVHLLQPPHGTIPGGERSCDLYALARVGSRFPHPPAYLRLPRGLAREWAGWAARAELLAQESLRRREAGERRYIVEWERRLGEEFRGRRDQGGQGGQGRQGGSDGASEHRSMARES